MSLPCAQDTGGENPYIDTEDVLGLLIVARLLVWDDSGKSNFRNQIALAINFGI
jgi:hypothetical protein